MIENRVDLHLIAEVQRGNKQAFNALVLKYQYKIFKVVARYVRDPSEVLDVTQETFIKAYRALHQFRGDSAFYTWLYRIAVNTAKNQLISKGRRLPEIDFEIMDLDQFIAKNDVQEGSTPEHLLLRDEIEHVVYETIDHLPDELKTAIILREIEGFSYEDIAKVMDCPIGTVRSRIYRAREVIDNRIQPFTKR